MTKTLGRFIVVTDLLFLAYWSVSLLALAKLIDLPPGMMYGDYDQARVVAWNWSFLPLDILFSISGLSAVRFARRGDPRWRPVAIISLCLTFVAGLMAVAYWTIIREFEPTWYLPNLALAVWPLFFLPGLVGSHPGTNGRDPID